MNEAATGVKLAALEPPLPASAEDQKNAQSHQHLMSSSLEQ